MLSLMPPWHYGVKGFYRVMMVFESNVHSMFSKTLPKLPPKGYKEQECGVCTLTSQRLRRSSTGSLTLLPSRPV